MHFEVLVEDQSGSIALEHILEKILGTNYSEHSWQIRSYKGIGRLPKNAWSLSGPANRLLLDNLPRLLRGYGKGRQDFPAAVVVVVDLDDKDCIAFQAGIARCVRFLQSSAQDAFQNCN